MISVDDKAVDSWSKTLALFAVLVYVCGYLIITIRNSDYGFASGEILKPRIVAAGAIFLLLLFLPSFVANKVLPLATEGTPSSLAERSLALLTYGIEIGCLVFLRSILLHDDPPGTPTGSLNWHDYLKFSALVVFAVIFAFLFTQGRKYLSRYPRSIATICIACVTIQVYLWVIHLSKVDESANLWLFSVGLIGCWIYGALLKKKTRFSSYVLPVCVFLFVVKFYAELVYPHVYQRWGGGQPVSIALSSLEKSTNKSSEFMRAELLDEDSAGIYVRYNSNDVAVFIPKDSISRLCFLERSQPHEFLDLVMPSAIAYEGRPSDMKGCSP